jgi:hypothetical protein
MMFWLLFQYGFESRMTVPLPAADAALMAAASAAPSSAEKLLCCPKLATPKRPLKFPIQHLPSADGTWEAPSPAPALSEQADPDGV